MQWFFTNQTGHANQFFNFAHHWNCFFLPDLTGHVQHVTSMFLDFYRTHWKHLLFNRWLQSAGTPMQIIINMTKEMQLGMKGGDMQKHQVLLIFVIIIFRHDVLRSPPDLSKNGGFWWFLHQAMYVWIYHDLSIHSMYIFNIFNIFYPSWAPILDSGADPKSSKMDRKSWPQRFENKT